MFGGHRPPPGWTIDSGRLTEDPRVLGYLQRGCAMHGHCQVRDCRRSVTLALEQLQKEGQALLPMRQVLQTLRCNRLSGCAIRWRETPRLIPTLGMIVQRDHIAIEVRCLGPCRSSPFVTTVAAFAARLQAAGTGGRDTPLHQLAEAIPEPCGRCRRPGLWQVEVLWYDPSQAQPMGRKVPLWKSELDARLGQARHRAAQAQA